MGSGHTYGHQGFQYLFRIFGNRRTLGQGRKSHPVFLSINFPRVIKYSTVPLIFPPVYPFQNLWTSDQLKAITHKVNIKLCYLWLSN